MIALRTLVCCSLSLSLVAGCDEKKDASPQATATAASQASKPAAAPETSAKPEAKPAAPAADAGKSKLAVRKGKASFLIDAPLEKIKGKAEAVEGEILLDPADLSKAGGKIRVKMSTLVTETFSDAGKNESQSDHARNWMEVGSKSPADRKAKHEWATFTIAGVEGAAAKLADVPEKDGVREVKGKVKGTLELHGVSSPKTVAFVARFKGPEGAPTEVDFKTDGSFDLSLKEHDIKPRDELGAFLNGALDRIGKKIDDRVQVSFEVSAAK